jgi:methyltransferase (TIGR00027 family)
VLAFKRKALNDHGDAPRAERREIAIDLRDDWATALKASGFDPSRPSAWIAEGLLIYLPAIAQKQLFEGIDALSSPGSWVAVEEGRPMPSAAFEAKRAEERASDAEGTFFTLVFNEQHAPADEWFAAHGWTAESTRLATYMRDLGRPMPEDDPDVSPMVGSISLVSATKR